MVSRTIKTSTIILFITLSAVAIFFNSCTTKQVSNGDFICKCDCKESDFECNLSIDKEIKLLHQEKQHNEKD